MNGQTTFIPELEEIVLNDLKKIGCEMTINGNNVVKPTDISVSQNAKTYAIEPAKDDTLLYWTLAPKIDLQVAAFPDFVQIKTRLGASYSIRARSSNTEAFHHEMDKMLTTVKEIYKTDAQS